MKSEIETSPKTRFYLATDSPEVKSAMKEEFGERLIMSDGVINRNSEDGIINAAVELYSLAKTSKILGSYYSSYSEMAARLGKIKLEVIKK